MDSRPSPSLFTILGLVQMRPGMYVGGTDSERTLQLDNLEMLITGYSLAVRQHQLRDAGFDLYAGFSSYLEERFGWSMSQGPISAIRHAATSDTEAWENFWRLLWDFRDAKESQAG
jgi:hypothetical protein